MNKVLVICEHNSARSQIFEAYLKKFGGNEYQVESAGLEPTQINPLVIEVMKEEGIDLGDKQTQSVFDLFRSGRLYDYVITVCDETIAAKCPIFPGLTQRLHMPFPDPALLAGPWDERVEKTREIRERIKGAVRDFIDDHEQFLVRASIQGFDHLKK